MYGIEGVVSGNETETPFNGDKCVICTWSIYEWRHHMRRTGWKTAATGIVFGDKITMEDDSGQEYTLEFDDVRTSRDINFLSMPRLKQPLTSTSGTRVDGISAEFENGLFNGIEIGANEESTQRITNFLDELRTSVGPSNKSSIFGRSSGDRKYVEKFIESGDRLFVRGQATQSDEYGTEKITPVKDGISVLSDKSMDEYKKGLEIQVSAIIGAVCSLILSSLVLGIRII